MDDFHLLTSHQFRDEKILRRQDVQCYTTGTWTLTLYTSWYFKINTVLQLELQLMCEPYLGSWLSSCYNIDLITTYIYTSLIWPYNVTSEYFHDGGPRNVSSWLHCTWTRKLADLIYDENYGKFLSCYAISTSCNWHYNMVNLGNSQQSVITDHVYCSGK